MNFHAVIGAIHVDVNSLLHQVGRYQLWLIISNDLNVLIFIKKCFTRTLDG